MKFRLVRSLGATSLGLASVLFPVTGASAATAPDPLAAPAAASAAPGSGWRPEPARYGVATQVNVPVRMADGTVLRATIATPADPRTGKPASDTFPVLLTQSPYGKDSAGQLGSSAIGVDPYFVRRGYIDVAVDVRGTGDSAGSFTLFDPQQVKDGVAIVNWAARLPHSSGRVGLHGASYLGINQLLVAGAIGPRSALKAIFPIVASNEVYRDTAFMGGIPDAEFDLVYLGGLLPAVNLINPVVDALVDPASLASVASVELQHLSNTVDYNALWVGQTYLGSKDAYDNNYWWQRSPGSALTSVVHNGIPAYLVGGEYDLFQRGEPLNYAALQNVWAGRPAGAPMLPDQQVTGRYQLLDGPFTHLGAAAGGSSTLDQLELRWFDTWLKGERTGMAQTRTPLHYFDLGRNAYAETTTFPFATAHNTRFYFGAGRTGTAGSDNDGSLSTTVPASAGDDQLSWLPLGTSMCDRSSDQWLMGAFTTLTSSYGGVKPCLDDDRIAQQGPTALTYTSAPFSRSRAVAGPIMATINARATSTDTEWVVNVEDVAPDGTSKPLTEGALIGSQRSFVASKSWPTLPWHPYTAGSLQPVVPGQMTTYEIEVFPTYATLAAGHRLRVTVSSTDFPHLMPTPSQLAALLGGVYRVHYGRGGASSITVPLIG